MCLKEQCCSKYEEIYPPELHEFVEMTDNTYSASQVRSMERRLLTEMDFEISAPTAHQFKLLFAARAQLPEK